MERQYRIELEIQKSENGLILDHYRSILNKSGYKGLDMLVNGIKETTKKGIGDENKNRK